MFLNIDSPTSHGISHLVEWLVFGHADRNPMCGGPLAQGSSELEFQAFFCSMFDETLVR
jgi:hypothetical protein